MDINKIWKAQSVPHPDLEGFYAKAEEFKTKRLRKVWIANGTLLSTGLFVLAIGFWVAPQYITTWAGIGLIILSMSLFLMVYNKMIPLYKSLDRQSSNRQYMETLLKIKQREAFLARRMINLYFILLSAGIALYMVEYVKMMNLKWGITVYGVTILWFAFNWFVLRPKQIKKNQKALNEVIDHLKALKQD